MKKLTKEEVKEKAKKILDLYRKKEAACNDYWVNMFSSYAVEFHRKADDAINAFNDMMNEIEALEESAEIFKIAEELSKK